MLRLGRTFQWERRARASMIGHDMGGGHCSCAVLCLPQALRLSGPSLDGQTSLSCALTPLLPTQASLLACTPTASGWQHQAHQVGAWCAHASCCSAAIGLSVPRKAACHRIWQLTGACGVWLTPCVQGKGASLRRTCRRAQGRRISTRPRQCLQHDVGVRGSAGEVQPGLKRCNTSSLLFLPICRLGWRSGLLHAERLGDVSLGKLVQKA